MWKLSVLICCGIVGLAACQPSVPDSGGFNGTIPDTGRGVGFNNSLAEARAREAALARESALAGQTTASRPPIAGVAGVAGPTTQVSAQPIPRSVDVSGRDPELAQIEADADARARAANSGQSIVNASPSNAAPVIVSNPGISSEQDFGSVSSQRSIEADAARIAANRAQREVVQPTALPTRSGGSQPNIVEYALATSHPLGTRVHRRVSLSSAAKFQRNCAAYASNDDAQADFLSSGGPRRDRKGLDPDGDGYACGWDPAAFRRVGG
ncbi:MAG: hypothetical protein ABJ246_02635 [Paracoccaceae bacterium]